MSNGSVYPSAFTILSGPGYVEAPVEWTRFAYDLSAYEGQTIRIAIACVSFEATAFFVDDVIIAKTVGIDDLIQAPSSASLKANYPNPFNPSTTISFELGEASNVEIVIYNLKGQIVQKLVSEPYTAGAHSVIWNGTDFMGNPVSSGVYYYKMSSGKFSSTRKMILMK